jgi:hypothetical protein
VTNETGSARTRRANQEQEAAHIDLLLKVNIQNLYLKLRFEEYYYGDFGNMHLIMEIEAYKVAKLGTVGMSDNCTGSHGILFAEIKYRSTKLVAWWGCFWIVHGHLNNGFKL